MSAFGGTISTWFGFVGSCVASPVGECLPFAAFLALALVASGALVGVVWLYRKRAAVLEDGPRRVRQHHVGAPVRERGRVEPRPAAPSGAVTSAVHGRRHATA